MSRARRRRPGIWPWLLACGGAWGLLFGFFARGAYVYNWKLDSGRSALILKQDWFGPPVVDFATVSGTVEYLWEAVAAGDYEVLELPFSSPVAAWAALVMLGIAGLACFAQVIKLRERRR